MADATPVSTSSTSSTAPSSFIHAKVSSTGTNDVVSAPDSLFAEAFRKVSVKSEGVNYKADAKIDRIIASLKAVYNKGKDWYRGDFPLSVDDIQHLCASAVKLLRKDHLVVNVPAPCKVFGDIHGQFHDLMRHFERWRSPEDDVHKVSYLFLGDYVDRGYNSLECICLLLAYKIKYDREDRFFLLRGNHELRSVNRRSDGLYPECTSRLGPVDGERVWNLLNSVFEFMPVAALISKRILAFHGGLSRSFMYLSQLEGIRRPITERDIAANDILYQLMWADPGPSDEVMGINENDRGPGVVTFGPDVVRQFCMDNELMYIIRAHEVVQDGFELFARMRMWTVFSATNYCYDSGNAGGMLLIDEKLTPIPHVMRPRGDPLMQEEQSKQFEKRDHSPVRARQARQITESGLVSYEDLQEQFLPRAAS